jgi:hypothetical protein
MLWLQPRDQLFAEGRWRPGALLSLRLDAWIAGPVFGWAEVEAKTEGWVSGNAWLDPNLAGRLGVALRL